MSVYKDRVYPQGAFLLIETQDGWNAAFTAAEIQSVRGRREGGTVLHTVNGGHVLLDLPTSAVLAALRGVSDAKSA